MNQESELTENEKKIIAALEKLAKLWKKHGNGLVLFNGNSLRRGNRSSGNEIAFFPEITGDGGDGGDCF